MPDEHTKVLAVDDEAADLYLMCNALRTKDFTVWTAANYTDAMACQHLKGAVDLLITDVSLPGRNGCELALDLMRNNPGMKVLFVSGTAGAEICRFYNLQVTDPHFLEKPFDANDLLQRVGKILSCDTACRPELIRPQLIHPQKAE